MLFRGTSLSFILLPLVVVLVATVVFLRWRIQKGKPEPIEKAFKTFRILGIALGVFVAALWFALPITPVLSTFGRPFEIGSLDEVLKYLQEYNDAIVRTTEVVHAFLFFFLFWFLLGVLEFAKAVSTASQESTRSIRADVELHRTTTSALAQSPELNRNPFGGL